MHAQQESLAARRVTAPVLVNETERRAALVEAMVLEGAELEGAGEREHRGADDPAIEGKPRAAKNDGRQSRVHEMGDQSEGSPDQQISQDHQGQEQGTVRPPFGEAAEQGEELQRAE